MELAQGMRIEKSGKKWIVRGQDKGWIFRKVFPRKWKAEVALNVFQEGGRVSDYWKAAREEQERRRSKQPKSGIHQRLARARELYPEGAVIPTSEPIVVCRQPGDWRKVQVTFDDLRHFHIDTVTGGVRAATPYPVLLARMWCDTIPEGTEFGHSWSHGPPPHEILVCITRSDNASIFLKLLSHVA